MYALAWPEMLGYLKQKETEKGNLIQAGKEKRDNN